MDYSVIHEIYMRRCLELARKGSGYAAPNPMVGCVIVSDGRIIGEGFHRFYGGPHAEMNAVNDVKNKELLKSATLYVNLEPCSHYGKTPPCASLIVENRIPGVVIGTQDPNDQVSGKGIRYLKENGAEVIIGVLENESNELNRRFFTFHNKKRPYIILKWAETRDGFIDRIRGEEDSGFISWITDETSRILVHKWRAEEQAVMVGSNTAITDNPQLTVRDWYGKNPIRMVIDRHRKLPSGLHLFDGTSETIIFNGQVSKDEKNLHYVKLPPGNEILQFILDHMHRVNIQSVMVEGGAILISKFITSGWWDEARVFTGDMAFGQGVKAPVIELAPVHEIQFSKSILRVYRNPG